MKKELKKLQKNIFAIDEVSIDFNEYCPECGDSNPFQDDRNGEIICQKCGLVLTERIPILLHGGLLHLDRHHMGDSRSLAYWDKNLTTHIPRRNDINKKELSPSMQSLVNRLRKRQNRFGGPSTSKERGLFITLDMLRSFSLLLNVKESIMDEAVILLRKFFLKNNMAGRKYESFVAAILYAACKLKRSPRNIYEISRAGLVEKKDVGRNYKFLVQTLKLKIPLLKLSEYIPRIAALSGVSVKIERRALEILNNVNEISGKIPWGIAGAAIYIAAKEYGEKKTQKEISEIIGVTEATLRNGYKQIKNLIEISIKS